MNNKSTLSLLFCLGFLLAAAPQLNAEAPVNVGTAAAEQIRLSPHITKILIEEMRTVDQGMGQIMQAIPRGDWKIIAETAQRIQSSYIMQQKLSAKDRAELHHSLPAGFKHLDAQFHQQAEQLSHAAMQHDAELVSFRFYRLTESCVQCHSSYAGHRFPGLVAPLDSDHGH
jgi:hypothetical protein